MKANLATRVVSHGTFNIYIKSLAILLLNCGIYHLHITCVSDNSNCVRFEANDLNIESNRELSGKETFRNELLSDACQYQRDALLHEPRVRLKPSEFSIFISTQLQAIERIPHVTQPHLLTFYHLVLVRT